MKRFLALLVLAAAPCAAQGDPWFSTFSIIAFDPATNELGVAVQSRAFAAGAAVPYAKPGVGAVATQAAANRSYGPKAIALLEQGLTPEEVVRRITDEDPGRDTRQVGVIDTKGRSAVYTGKRVIDRNFDPEDPVHFGGYAGHVTGRSFSVQGNTLASEAVVKAMADAYEVDQRGAAIEFRKHLGWYVKGLPSSADLRKRLHAVTSLMEVEGIFADYLTLLARGDIAERRAAEQEEETLAA